MSRIGDYIKSRWASLMGPKTILSVTRNENGDWVPTKKTIDEKPIPTATPNQEFVSPLSSDYTMPTSVPTASPIPGPISPLASDYAFPRSPISSPTATPILAKTPNYFGQGNEMMSVNPVLFDALMKIPDEKERIIIAELAGNESSYGHRLENVSPKEESYGAYHINLRAKRKNPVTGKPFTKEEAMDFEIATQYALEEMRKRGLGNWNPGNYDFYQNEIPKRAQGKRYVRG